jgi:hypothetical protein
MSRQNIWKLGGIMAIGYCYIPKTQTTWDYPDIKDINDLIESVKDVEGVKRIPHTWKLWIDTGDGRGMIEVNRRAASRERNKKDRIIHT